MHLTEGRESSTICCGASGAVSVNDLWRRLRRRIDDSAHCESVGLSVGTCRWTFHRSWISYALVQATLAPPLQTPTPCNPPPPPGDRHFHVFLVTMYCAGLCCPCALCMALNCFPITSNQAPVCVL